MFVGQTSQERSDAYSNIFKIISRPTHFLMNFKKNYRERSGQRLTWHFPLSC